MGRFSALGVSILAVAAALPAQARDEQDRKPAAAQDSTITVTATRIPADVKEVPATGGWPTS
jgi:hemoglobin/transferrin/lactoferrin receptor protein